MRRTWVLFVAFWLAAFCLAAPAEAATWYVTESGSGAEDGSDWDNAAKDLKAIMTGAAAGDTIWVAKGRYSPGDQIGHTFPLKKGVKVYGGFCSGDTDLASRDWRVNQTVLDGAGRNYHVVTANDVGAVSSDTWLDGFTVTGGKAIGGGDNSNGGGMFIYRAAPTVANCFFSGNRAENLGGGMYSTNNSLNEGVVVLSCTFAGNAAQDGGGMTCEYDKPILVNCTFAENSADQKGGGMYNKGNVTNNVLVMVNCTFSGNSAREGGGMCSGGEGVTSTLANTILWNNRAFVKGKDMQSFGVGATLSMDHCVIDSYDVALLVQNALIQVDPKLSSQDVNGNPATTSTDVYVYALDPGSSALDVGLAVDTLINNGALSARVPNVDRLVTSRPQGAGVDIGAFERVPGPGGGGPGGGGPGGGGPGTPSPTWLFIQASWDVGGRIRPCVGSLDAQGRIAVAPGDNVSFDIIPNTGYTTAEIRVDNKSVDVVPVYEFKNVRENHWIWASFHASASVPPPSPPPSSPTHPVVPPNSPDLGEVTQGQKKSSGGGCAAGWSSLALLAIAFVCVRRR